MRPIHWVNFTWGRHPGLMLSTRERMLVNPLVTVIPGQSEENLELVAQMVLGYHEGLPHQTYFAVDEVLSVNAYLVEDEIGVMGLDREPELLEKLTNAWGLHRPGGFPTQW